ncbi:MAG: deoxyribose-phosphate aldolase [Bacteroidota bacterium]
MLSTNSIHVNLARIIDHTFLRADCTFADVKVLCMEALQHQFCSVCIPPYYLFEAKKMLGNTDVKLCTVIGFPMGYSTTGAKVEEIKRACNDGADELDVVVNIAAIKSGDWNTVKNDIESTTMISHLRGRKIKLIIEMGLLEEKEVVKVCDLAVKSGVDFVKTSTGFNGSPITPEDITYLKAFLPKTVLVKASGGIRSKMDAVAMVKAGADRIGTSSGVKIVGNN